MGRSDFSPELWPAMDGCVLVGVKEEAHYGPGRVENNVHLIMEI